MDAKMLLISAYLLLIMPLKTISQVYDDFSDGDFTDNPAWHGDDSLFIVNTGQQLQLNAEGEGRARLLCSVPFSTGEASRHQPAEWRFWLREAFAPSTKNFCDIVLCDNYFIRFGQAGNNDVLELFRDDGSSSVSVCQGTDTFIASAFSACFKVTRDEQGNWKILVDKAANGNYVVDVQCVDNTYPISGYFGIKATFTSSNAKKIYLDDVYFGPLIVDTEPPLLENVTVLKYNKIQLDFNEPLDEITALDAGNYTVDNLLGSPMFAEFYGDNRACVVLSFSNTIQEAIYYTLTINNIQDLEGNVANGISYTFLHYTTHQNDIVINEIMADPEPVIGLPPCEYIELYNTTEFPINIKDWILVIGTSEKTITEDVEIQPDGYLILCKTDAVSELEPFGVCLGFSSFTIANSGVGIIIKDAEQKLISSVKFNLAWYHDSAKMDGGWSIEQIDPSSACAGAGNWRASCSRQGGTPGAINSVDAPNLLAPEIDYIDVLSSNSLEMVFNQNMDKNSLENIMNFTLVEFDSHPVAAESAEDRSDRVVLTFDQSFQFHDFYKIKVSNLDNCSGVALGDDTCFCFGMPDEAEAFDVVINEILFDPIAPSGDYVELYNKSDKALNISDFKLGVVKESFPNPPDTAVKSICSEHRQILPRQYVLLTTTPNETGSQYECSTDNFIMMSAFPSYPNSGAAALLLFKGEVIDAVSYSQDMHYPLLTVTKGVALERVSQSVASDQPDNWHSAAAPLYGTPGYQNSVFVENPEVSEHVGIFPSTFSPDGDGFDDVTTIHLNDFDNDYTVRITVFDSHGKFVKTLVNNQNLGNQSQFVWNGLDENGSVVPVGIYVVFVETFDIQGDMKVFKKAVVVAAK